MKRQVFNILIIAIIIASGSIQAQSVTFRVNYDASTPAWYDRYDSYGEYEYDDLRKDKVELEFFRREVDHFRRSAKRDELFRIRRLKAEIMDLMKQEIRDSRHKVRHAEQELRYENESGLRRKGYRAQQYGKREGRARYKGRSYKDDLRDLERRKELVRDQIAILFKLENSYLDGSYSYRQQVRDHIRLMHQFEKTLERDLHLSRVERKEDLYGR